MVWEAKPDKQFKDIETIAQGKEDRKKTDSENLVYYILNIGTD